MTADQTLLELLEQDPKLASPEHSLLAAQVSHLFERTTFN